MTHQHSNRFKHFTTPIEDATIHFIHERSPRADAVPLLMLHGWPGKLLAGLDIDTYNAYG